MCLAIPAKILSLDEMHAVVDVMGAKTRVNILPIERPKVGDHILVHAGYAICVIETSYADFLNDALGDMLEDER